MTIYVIKDYFEGGDVKRDVYIPIEYIEHIQLRRGKQEDCSEEIVSFYIKFMTGNWFQIDRWFLPGESMEEKLEKLYYHFNTILKAVENLKYTSKEISDISASAKTI
jgi:hypothetical protein